MKRVLWLLFPLFICINNAFAENGLTEKLNMFEFLDLYENSLMQVGEIEDADYSFTEDERLTALENILISYAGDVESIVVPDGMLFVSVPEFDIVGISYVITDANQTEIVNAQRIARAIAAYAVLEDYGANSWLTRSASPSISPRNKLYMYEIEFCDKYLKVIESSRFSLYPSQGKDSPAIPMVSGNYDYSLKYDANSERTTLIIKARE